VQKACRDALFDIPVQKACWDALFLTFQCRKHAETLFFWHSSAESMLRHASTLKYGSKAFHYTKFLAIREQAVEAIRRYNADNETTTTLGNGVLIASLRAYTRQHHGMTDTALQHQTPLQVPSEHSRQSNAMWNLTWLHTETPFLRVQPSLSLSQNFTRIFFPFLTRSSSI
jgi:hypothetical protein